MDNLPKAKLSFYANYTAGTLTEENFVQFWKLEANISNITIGNMKLGRRILFFRVRQVRIGLLDLL